MRTETSEFTHLACFVRQRTIGNAVTICESRVSRQVCAIDEKSLIEGEIMQKGNGITVHALPKRLRIPCLGRHR